MVIHKCDMCGKRIKDKKATIGVSVNYYSVELCAKCADPVVDFLDSKQLLLEALKDSGLRKKPNKVS